MTGTLGANNPCVVWATCVLWVVSLFSITWALIVLFWLGDILLITQADIVIALLLLSGIVMLPTNVFMIYSISNGLTIDKNSKVLCCPLWVLKVWIIAINIIGAAISFQRLYMCGFNTKTFIELSMKNYRNMPRYKHFMDNLQWSLKCCGLDSYQDWFHHNWNERLRDYEWDSAKISMERSGKDVPVADSVPLSCCKSGTCVSNYLIELGTHSINTRGCRRVTHNGYVLSMSLHFIVFLLIAILEVIILGAIFRKENDYCEPPHGKVVNVRHIMPVNNRFELNTSSSSCRLEDSDFEALQHYPAGMVFLSVINWARARGPDEFWRKRRIFRLAAHYIGRRRNCYTVAVRNVHRALVYATKARKLKKEDMRALWSTRIMAACEQHNMTHFSLKEGLERSNIMLDKKSLSDLACWEPRTFESLAAIAKEKLELDGFIDGNNKHPTGINLNLKDVMLEHWLKEKKGKKN